MTPPPVATVPTKSGGFLAVAGVLLLLVAGGGGAWYLLKPNPIEVLRANAVKENASTVQPPSRYPPSGLKVPVPESDSPSAYVGRARVMLSQHQHRDAVAELSQGLSRHPNDASLLAERGRASLWSADYPAAMNDFRTSLSANPGDVDTRCELLRLKMNFEQPTAALAETQPLISQSASDPRVVEVLAQAYLWSDDVTSAQKWFAYLRQLDPAAGRRLYDRGRAWLDAGVYASANLDLCSAMWIDPTDAAACYDLGRARVALGQKQRAIEAFERYLMLDPASANANEVRAELARLRR